MNNNTELKHHGVPGMKWGVRKAQDRVGVPASRRTTRLENKIRKQKEVVKSWKDTAPVKDGWGRTIFTEQDCKDMCEGAKKRLAKLEYKLLISKKRDKINAGESAIGRLYNKITAADKMQAEIEYEMERRPKGKRR